MKTVTTISALCAGLLAISACSTPAGNSAPTHQWATTAAVDEQQYRRDHQGCLSDAGLVDRAREYSTSDYRFQQYTQCMNQHGYVLNAYERNPSRAVSQTRP